LERDQTVIGLGRRELDAEIKIEEVDGELRRRNNKICGNELALIRAFTV
jgi:hypothetical protein